MLTPEEIQAYKTKGCVRPTAFDSPSQKRRWKKLKLVKELVFDHRRVGLISRTSEKLRKEWILMQPQVIAKAITPQPKPQAKGQAVLGTLLDMISHADLRCVPNRDDLAEMVKLRADTCAEEYGQPLMTGDGRDTQAEILQEAVDMMQYFTKAYQQTGNRQFAVYINILMIITSECMVESLFGEVTCAAE